MGTAFLDKSGTPSLVATSGALVIGTSSAADTIFLYNGSEVGRISSGGLAVDISSLTDSLVYTSASFVISANTIDTADSSRIQITAGGAVGLGRGGYLDIAGNEHDTLTGSAQLWSGNHATAELLLGTGGVGPIRFYVNNLQRWLISSTAGNLSQNATNGGDIVLTKASTSVCQPVANAVSGAGTTITDATQLTAVYNRVTTVAASTGVKLWDATVGTMIVVSNLGASDLEVYPPDANGVINTAAAGVALTLAAATNQMGIFIKTAANTWVAMVGAGPDT